MKHPEQIINLARLVACLVALLACCVSLPDASAQYTFSRIIDTSTTRPGETDLFTSFREVYYDGQNVAFVGQTDSDVEGVFRWNGSTLSTVADTTMSIPGSSGTFTDFRSLALSQGAVAFVSEGTVVDGVFTDQGGSFRTVADTTTTMPGSTVPFTSFLRSDVEIDGDRIAFSAFGTNQINIFNEGAYLEDGGTLGVVADRSNTIPSNGEQFIFFGEVDVDGSGVVFDGGRGTGGGNGFYTDLNASPGQFNVVYNADTVIPGLTQPNSIFSPNAVRMDNGDFAFRARGDNDVDGIFLLRNGVYETVVDESTVDPQTGSNFRTAFSYSLDNGAVTFTGFSNGPTGLYLYQDGQIEEVINTGDFLEGNDISGLTLSRGALSGEDFVFRASFTDGTSAIYLAEAPVTGEPETVTILPEVDAQLRPGNAFPLGDADGTTIDIDGGSGVNFPRLDALLEFPFGDLPEDATVTAATLEITPLLGNPITIEAFGYAGDGLASLSDEDALTELLGTGAVPGDNPLAITLDTDFINALLAGEASHLGIRLASASAGPFNEIVSSEGTDDQAPKLLLEFTLPGVDGLAGDFNDDGVVDAADYTVWRDGLGTTYTQEDYNAWAANYGATAAPAAAVPEPTGVATLLLALSAAGAVTRRS